MNHLPADIDFERQVTGKRGPVKVTFDGNTAWVIALTDYDGTFQGSPGQLRQRAARRPDPRLRSAG